MRGNSALQPICRQRVFYMGNRAVRSTKADLDCIQKALKTLYSSVKSEQDRSGPIDCWVSVNADGLSVTASNQHKNNSTTTYPLTQLHYCAAVRFCNVANGSGRRKKFLPLDDPAAKAESIHPPIFAAVFRENEEKRKTLKCYAFFCASVEIANGFVRACFLAYSESILIIRRQMELNSSDGTNRASSDESEEKQHSQEEEIKKSRKAWSTISSKLSKSSTKKVKCVGFSNGIENQRPTEGLKDKLQTTTVDISPKKNERVKKCLSESNLNVFSRKSDTKGNATTPSPGANSQENHHQYPARNPSFTLPRNFGYSTERCWYPYYVYMYNSHQAVPYQPTIPLVPYYRPWNQVLYQHDPRTEMNSRISGNTFRGTKSATMRQIDNWRHTHGKPEKHPSNEYSATAMYTSTEGVVYDKPLQPLTVRRAAISTSQFDSRTMCKFKQQPNTLKTNHSMKQQWKNDVCSKCASVDIYTSSLSNCKNVAKKENIEELTCSLDISECDEDNDSNLAK